MDEVKPRKEEKCRSRRNVNCPKTGDHVHYPPNRKNRSTRIRHAPSLSSGLESLFRLVRKKRYGECRKNHAAEIGTTAYDGCGEFVSVTTAAGEEEDSVKCVACGCHRNFHREELISENDVTETVLDRSPPHAVLEMLKISSDQFRQIFCSPYGERKKEKEDRIVVDRSRGGDLAEEEVKVKRLKTKFTAEQTEKMRNYAEKLQWKMNRENQEEVDEICLEIGVTKKNFRTWMNNHRDKS